MNARPFMRKAPGRCKCCERPIEPGFILICRRCYSFMPDGPRKQLRLAVVQGRKHEALLDQLVKSTREKFPQTRPPNLRDKSPLGPSPIVGMDLASGPDQIAHITIE